MSAAQAAAGWRFWCQLGPDVKPFWRDFPDRIDADKALEQLRLKHPQAAGCVTVTPRPKPYQAPRKPAAKRFIPKPQ
jgi:hypothetical protein